MTETVSKRPVAALIADGLIFALKSMGEGVLAHVHMDREFDKRLRASKIADFKRENPGKVVTAEQTSTPS